MISLRNYTRRMIRIIIFYILLHTAMCALQNNAERSLDDQINSKHLRQSKQTNVDKILANINSLLEEVSSDGESSEDYNNFNYKPNEKQKEQLNKVLNEITNLFGKIKDEHIKYNEEGLITIEIPEIKQEKRYKRDLYNETESNVTPAENNDTVTVSTTEQPETIIAVTEKIETLSVEFKNETENETTALKNDEILTKNDTVLNTRRILSYLPPNTEFVKVNSRVKDKLLSYLQDTFNEVERKIKPLTNIKIALSNDDHYKIGYIIATIDTLEVNLKKLKNDMALHHQYWDDEKILDLFDRIKATNKVATSLIESLKRYLPSK